MRYLLAATVVLLGLLYWLGDERTAAPVPPPPPPRSPPVAKPRHDHARIIAPPPGARAPEEAIAQALVPPLRPKSWPERFEPDAIKRAVLSAITASGAPYDLRVLDCSEFPCVAWIAFDRSVIKKPLSLEQFFEGYDDDNITLGGCHDASGTSYVRISMWPDIDGQWVTGLSHTRPSVRSALCELPD